MWLRRSALCLCGMGWLGQGRGTASLPSLSGYHRCQVGEVHQRRVYLNPRSPRIRNIPTNSRRHRFLTNGIIALRIMEAA